MSSTPNPLAAHYALIAARFAFSNGDYQAVLTLTDEALALSPLIEDELWLLRYQGDAHRAMSSYLKAAYQYEQALELARRSGDDLAETQILTALGRVAGNQGAYRAAHAYYLAVMERHRQRNHPPGIADALNNLGTVSLRRGDLRSAIRYHDESLSIWRTLNDSSGIAQSLYALAEAALAQGEYEKAQSYMRESLELYQQSGQRKEVARVINGIGLAILLSGDIEMSYDYFQQSLEMRQLLLDRKGEAACWQSIGWAALTQKQTTRALDAFQRALTIQEAISYRYGSAQTLVYMGFTQLDHALPTAQSHFKNGLQQAHRIGAKLVALEAVVGLACWAWRAELRDKSIEWLTFVVQQNISVTGMVQPIVDALEALQRSEMPQVFGRYRDYRDPFDYEIAMGALLTL